MNTEKRDRKMEEGKTRRKLIRGKNKKKTNNREKQEES